MNFKFPVIKVVWLALIMCALPGCRKFMSSPLSTPAYGTKIKLTSGIGVPNICEPGMRMSEILRGIGMYAKYHNPDVDYYAKYEWGLEICNEGCRERNRIYVLLFRVQPVEYATNDIYRPYFENGNSMFRGVLDSKLDFSDGKVRVEEVLKEYGDVEVVFRQGEPYREVGTKAHEFLGGNDEVMAIFYPAKGVSFIFDGGFVSAFTIFKPLRLKK